MSKEIVKKENKEVGSFSVEDEKMLAQMSKDSESYVDNTKAEDCAIPRLKLLQSLSPEVTKANEEFVEGAEAGDMLHSITKKVYKGREGLLFVPCYRKTSFIEWKDRNSGGGLVNNYGSDETEYNKCYQENGKHINSESGNEIVRSIDVYGYIVDILEKKSFDVILSFSKTKMKKMQNWNVLIRSLCDAKTGKQLPSYAGVYEITSTPETGVKGSWFNLRIKSKGYTLGISEIGGKIYEKGKIFAKLVGESKIKVNHENEGGFVDKLKSESGKI